MLSIKSSDKGENRKYFTDLKKREIKSYIQSIPSHSKQIFVLGKILLPVHIWNTGAILYTEDWKIWL